jgi:hypothetical protein
MPVMLDCHWQLHQVGTSSAPFLVTIALFTTSTALLLPSQLNCLGSRTTMPSTPYCTTPSPAVSLIWTRLRDICTSLPKGFCNKENHAIVINEFHGLQQGDLSITACWKEQKRIAGALRNTNYHILVLNVLCCLNKMMASAATAIAMSTVLPNFASTGDILLCEKMRLTTSTKAEADFALLSTTKRSLPPCSGTTCHGGSSNKKQWRKKGNGSGQGSQGGYGRPQPPSGP